MSNFGLQILHFWVARIGMVPIAKVSMPSACGMGLEVSWISFMVCKWMAMYNLIYILLQTKDVFAANHRMNKKQK